MKSFLDFMFLLLLAPSGALVVYYRSAARHPLFQIWSNPIIFTLIQSSTYRTELYFPAFLCTSLHFSSFSVFLCCISLNFSAFSYISLHFSEFLSIFLISLHFPTFLCISLNFSAYFLISLHFPTFLCISLNFSAFSYISLHFSRFLCIYLHFSEFICISLHFSAFYIWYFRTKWWSVPWSYGRHFILTKSKSTWWGWQNTNTNTNTNSKSTWWGWQNHWQPICEIIGDWWRTLYYRIGSFNALSQYILFQSNCAGFWLGWILFRHFICPKLI